MPIVFTRSATSMAIEKYVSLAVSVIVGLVFALISWFAEDLPMFAKERGLVFAGTPTLATCPSLMATVCSTVVRRWL